MLKELRDLAKKLRYLNSDMGCKLEDVLISQEEINKIIHRHITW